MRNSSIFAQKKVIYFENYIALNYDLIVSTNSLVVYCLDDPKKITATALKNMHTVTLSYPSVGDSFIYLSDLFDKYNIKYEQKTLVERTNKHNGNIREIIMNTLLDSTGIENEFRYLDNFQVTRYIMNNYKTPERAEDLVYYLYYENFPESTKKPNLLQTYLKINDIFFDASIFERSSGDISRELKHSSLSIYNSTKKQENSQMRFSQILSKLSHRNITNKKTKNLPI